MAGIGHSVLGHTFHGEGEDCHHRCCVCNTNMAVAGMSFRHLVCHTCHDNKPNDSDRLYVCLDCIATHVETEVAEEADGEGDADEGDDSAQEDEDDEASDAKWATVVADAKAAANPAPPCVGCNETLVWADDWYGGNEGWGVDC